jgi:hypothetical protein
VNDLAAGPNPKISAAEMQIRLEAVQQAAANNRIEGQFSSPEVDAIFDAFIAGDIEFSALLPMIRALNPPR